MFIGKEGFKNEYMRYLKASYGRDLNECTTQEKYINLVNVVSALAADVRLETTERQKGKKKVYYFSMEFLMGRLLENYLINLEIRDVVKEAITDLGEDFDTIIKCELDPGLGNGGLGRLAACFLDSMAALDIPCTGMGIRYQFGLFRQKIENGYQKEEPDAWLENDYPWEVARPEDAVVVRFGGQVERSFADGKMKFRHKDYSCVRAVPYHVPIVGFEGKAVNHLKLWRATPLHDRVDMDAFNRGDYCGAMKEKNDIEAISCILYPDDSQGVGRLLRLKQEYFFVAAGVGDICRRYVSNYGHSQWDKLPERVSIHINDTHPTLCIPELMRILLDEEKLEWDEAWEITKKTISFTNHTVLPEALEKWPIDMFKDLLPRIYMIVEEINRRWNEQVTAQAENAFEILKKTAVLYDNEVRMANLSIIGSHSVNGVAALHTEILKTSVFEEFHKINPEKFFNMTNGVSHRRFMIQSNLNLADLILDAIGDRWLKDLNELKRLEEFKNDSAFMEQLMKVKRNNKIALGEYIYRHNGIKVDPDSVFDIQVKRMHAYKRQLLNAFKVLDLYNQIKSGQTMNINPYTFVFSGKAAQGYAFAKETIKFINSIADLVNNDPEVSRLIKVVFIENFCVTNGQYIYPAADISEQISTAGKEASGTGCMKFIMNGAVTLGTLDGANVEIKEHVGDDNIVIFGLTADEAMNYHKFGGYSAYETVEADARLKKLTTQLVDNTFMGSGCNFWGIYDALLQQNDEYFVLKDFDSYMKAWTEMDKRYSDRAAWGAMSLANIANSGFFSSDRTIKEYADKIWNIEYRKR